MPHFAKVVRRIAWAIAVAGVGIFLALVFVPFPERARGTEAEMQLGSQVRGLGETSRRLSASIDHPLAEQDILSSFDSDWFRADPVVTYVTTGRSTAFYYVVVEVRMRDTQRWAKPFETDVKVPVVFPEEVYRPNLRTGHVPVYFNDDSFQRDCVSPMLFAILTGGPKDGAISIPETEHVPYSAKIDRLRVIYVDGEIR